MSKRGFAVFLLALVPLPSCTHKVEVQPVKIEPIHLTVDLNVRVDRRLDEFFANEEEPLEENPEADQLKEGST